MTTDPLVPEQSPSSEDASFPPSQDSPLDSTAFARMLEASGDALVVLDAQWRYVSVNDAAQIIIGHTREQLIGRKIHEVFPEIVNSVFWPVYTRAVREQALLTIEDYFAPLDMWFDIRVLPHNGLLYLHFRETTLAHRAADAERAAQDRITALLESMDEAFLSLDRDWNITYINQMAARISGKNVEDIAGRNYWQVWPMLVGSQAGRNYRRALKDNTPVHYERYSEAAGSWVEVRVYPAPEAPGGGLNIFFRDITARKQAEAERQEAERRERFLADLITRTRPLLDPDAVLEETLRSVGDFLRLNRFLYADVDEASGIVTARREYCEERGLENTRLTWPLAALGTLAEDLRAGHSTINNDTATDPRSRDRYETVYRPANVRAVVTVPLKRDSRWVGYFAAMTTTPREWTPDEVALLEGVTERMWVSLENARLFQATQEAEAKQRRIAETLQHSMLLTPPAADDFPGLEVDTHYEAAWEEALIGGDYGDVFKVDKFRVALIAGDCTGKGLEAARFVAECEFMARAFVRENPDDPSDALSRLNRALVNSQKLDNRPDNALTTLAITVIDTRTGETVLASGGAEPPLLLRRETEEAIEIETGGAMLGIDSGVSFQNAHLTLSPGDILVLTTDGTTESRNRASRQFFGYTGLIRAVRETVRESGRIEDSARKIVEQAKAFAGGVLADDACVLIARFTGGGD